MGRHIFFKVIIFKRFSPRSKKLFELREFAAEHFQIETAAIAALKFKHLDPSQSTYQTPKAQLNSLSTVSHSGIIMGRTTMFTGDVEPLLYRHLLRRKLPYDA